MIATRTLKLGDSPDLGVRQLAAQSPKAGRPAILFVHGLGHGGWCWDNWLRAASADGYDGSALSLRGHESSEGTIRGTRLRHYVDDVVRTVEELAADQIVLIGHSLGGLIVQKAITRCHVKAAVLVASIPSGPAVRTAFAMTRQDPRQTIRFVAGRSMRFPTDILFNALDSVTAADHRARMVPNSAVAQYQLLLHRPAARPLGSPPVLSIGSTADRLVPIKSQRATARRYGADLIEFDDVGHDMMLDDGWDRVWHEVSRWLDTRLAVSSRVTSTRDSATADEAVVRSAIRPVG